MSTTVEKKPQNGVRVILVGPTGLDPTLRLDPDIELVRVRTPIQAIGEASGVSEPDAPQRALVVLSPDTEHGLADDDQARFLSALRRVAPAVKVAIVGEDRSAGAFDAALTPGCSAGAVRAMFGLGDGVQAPDSTAEDPQVEALLDRVLDEPPAPGLAGDEQIVAQLLTGRDITAAAVELVKRRVGDPSVRFIPGPDEHPGTPVTWRGFRLGTLVADNAHAARLTDAAAWLGAWLAMERQMAQLRHEAFTDALTGAWNRRFFDRHIDGALQRALEDRRSLTLLMFDIDDFKRFNDDYGHAAGDLILRETVRLLRSVIRPTDKVCRMGGDEFVVIFDDPQGRRDPASQHPGSVFEIANRFQEQIAQQRFPMLGLEAPGTLTISGGLATFPWDGRSATELLETADRRSRQSKRQGKNVMTIGPGGG
ncbi:MAG: GGDEF domain-containing protein [Planctomycetes bacterium]|nr:GGDEF domain-containing protein [Planctomycetota bacterium]